MSWYEIDIKHKSRFEIDIKHWYLKPQISTVLKNAKNQDLAFYQEENLGENPSLQKTVLYSARPGNQDGKASKCQQNSQDLGIFGQLKAQSKNLKLLGKLSSFQPLMRPMHAPEWLTEIPALRISGEITVINEA